MIPYEESEEYLIKKDYFEWMYDRVCKVRVNKNISYKRLFILLHSIEFVPYMKKDLDRALDGCDLRVRFASINRVENIHDILFGPATVLEVIVALAIKCEDTIMSNSAYGDRTPQWFWGMMKSLGIDCMTDDIFDEDYVTEKIYTFMERKYKPDGNGGLFYIPNYTGDLRTIEIWGQMNWYLNRFIY